MRAASFSRSLADRPITAPAMWQANRDRGIRWSPGSQLYDFM